MEWGVFYTFVVKMTDKILEQFLLNVIGKHFILKTHGESQMWLVSLWIQSNGVN